ncbi:MAG: DUF115 domain-containing protein [Methanobacteriaceae archaeon]
MDLETWFLWYQTILEDFGFNIKDDEESAHTLNKLLKDKNVFKPEKININKNVVVFGAGPSIKKNINELKKIGIHKFTIIAADGATTALLEENITPNIIVTDLDGEMEDILKADQSGSLLVVHSHGNNQDKIKKYVPLIKNVIGTSQSTPIGNLHNFGGFTDGDRCVFLAIKLNAELIVLAGMDFGKTVTSYSRPDLGKLTDQADDIKILKLEYAKKLIEWAAENENVEIVNISQGDTLKGVKNVSVDQIRFK